MIIEGQSGQETGDAPAHMVHRGRPGRRVARVILRWTQRHCARTGRATKRKVRLIVSHPSNRGRRFRAALTALKFEVNSIRGAPTEACFGDGLRVGVSKGGNSSERVVYARLPDWPEMPIWQRWLRHGDHFADVGANVGLYSLLAAERGCTVHAFEPAPDMTEQMRLNVRRNGIATVILSPIALMDSECTVDLVGPDPNQRTAVRAEAGGSTRATTLDKALSGKSLRGLKIDVEGNERLVLDGSTSALSDPELEMIQVEWNDYCEAALGETREPVAEYCGGRVSHCSSPAPRASGNLRQTICHRMAETFLQPEEQPQRCCKLTDLEQLSAHASGVQHHH